MKNISDIVKTSDFRLLYSVYALRDAMGDPGWDGAYRHRGVGGYSWGEASSLSWGGEHVNAEFPGIQATLSATLRRFSSRESLVVQVHHRGVTACSRT